MFQRELNILEIKHQQGLISDNEYNAVKGLSKVKVDKVPEGKEDSAREAIESCPTAAIEEVNE